METAQFPILINEDFTEDGSLSAEALAAITQNASVLPSTTPAAPLSNQHQMEMPGIITNMKLLPGFTQLLVITHNPNQLLLVNFENRSMEDRFRLPFVADQIRLSPDGRFAAALHPDQGRISLFDLTRENPRQILSTGQAASDCLFNQENSRMWVIHQTAEGGAFTTWNLKKHAGGSLPETGRKTC